MTSTEYKTIIINHYEGHFGPRNRELRDLGKGMRDLPEGFCILEFPPHHKKTLWTYATCEMSQISDEIPIELQMFTLHQTTKLVEVLTAVAHYHRTATRIGLGHSVNFGQPWINNSSCEFGLVSLPYLDGPSLENLSLGTKTIKFYWLIPITKSEVDYKRKNGLEALEEKLDSSDFNYADPHRESVC